MLLYKCPSGAVETISSRATTANCLRSTTNAVEHFLKEEIMPQCVMCDNRLQGADICPHHIDCASRDWAEGNRIMCDFLHRKKLPPRLAMAERDDAGAHREDWRHDLPREPRQSSIPQRYNLPPIPLPRVRQDQRLVAHRWRTIS
ncbi:hypothetical protein C4552_03965 [Candidatus Parcubacteria bacterium]|nr:MAG: hypothetical protein C4552_03965 [Candidatus Parcubacteria bacterium]